METACTSLRDPADSSGNPGTGRDESPFLSAESPTPGEADNVVSDIFRPRDDCAEDANLPSELEEHHAEPASPISEPRASHELLGERPNSKELDVPPHETAVSTVFGQNFASHSSRRAGLARPPPRVPRRHA